MTPTEREFILALAERIFLAHEVLGRLAEKRTRKEPKMKKERYVLIESADPHFKINGFDSWLCPWRGLDLEETLAPIVETMTHGQTWALTLTMLEMDQAEYDAYCVEHDIDLED